MCKSTYINGSQLGYFFIPSGNLCCQIIENKNNANIRYHKIMMLIRKGPIFKTRIFYVYHDQYLAKRKLIVTVWGQSCTKLYVYSSSMSSFLVELRQIDLIWTMWNGTWSSSGRHGAFALLITSHLVNGTHLTIRSFIIDLVEPNLGFIYLTMLEYIWSTGGRQYTISNWQYCFQRQSCYLFLFQYPYLVLGCVRRRLSVHMNQGVRPDLTGSTRISGVN